MPSVVLSKIAQPEQLSNFDLYNLNTPVSYDIWVKNNIGIIPESSYQQYESYLNTFYRNKKIKNTQHVNTLRNDYLTLVKQLSLLFTDDDEFQRFAKIDFDSSLDLKLAIPYFARKLKDIAKYYITVRESIKNTKIQYASIGSEIGLERFLYSKLLEGFSNRIPFDNSSSVSIPDSELQNIRDNFKITIEELYNDYNPFTDEALTINPLYCILNEIICDNESEFLLNRDTDPLSRTYLCDTDIITDDELIIEGWGAYLGTDLYYISGGGYQYLDIDVNLDFQQGNNFFYWFSGEAVFEIPEGIYEDKSLSSIDWSNATASDTIDGADIIFTSYGNLKTEGAWLMSADKITSIVEMTATMTDGKEFKFPYPGHGVSAENVNWSGRLLTDIEADDKRFFPNELSFQENRKEIDKLYWSDITSISSIDSISIQNLTLYDDGAFASKIFTKADRLIIRSNTGNDKLHDVVPNSVYWGNNDIAWLYDFDRTQIPITQGDNSIYYPLTSFDSSSDLSIRYTSGQPQPLSSIPVNSAFRGAVAGDDISNSDLIIKKKSACGPDIEAAWLEGLPLSALRVDDPNYCYCGDPNKLISPTGWYYTKGTTQPGLSFKVDTLEYLLPCSSS